VRDLCSHIIGLTIEPKSAFSPFFIFGLASFGHPRLSLKGDNRRRKTLLKDLSHFGHTTPHHTARRNKPPFPYKEELGINLTAEGSWAQKSAIDLERGMEEERGEGKN